MLMVAQPAFAQNPPPGAIFDLSTVHPTAFSPDNVFTQFTTSFVADLTGTEYVSFAFREVPAYFSFDDACVTATTCTSSNLLADPGLESDTPANVGTNFPVSWDRWIQPVDVSAIGVVASASNPEACGNSGPHTGTYFWCDGSVEGFDALYQPVSVVDGTTYTISWWLTDNSGSPITNPTIDMLVYAGDQIPVGTQQIGTPEPATFGLMGLGLVAVGIIRRRDRKSKV
jgi:hypothetical protein